jgi:hypothetical protein
MQSLLMVTPKGISGLISIPMLQISPVIHCGYCYGHTTAILSYMFSPLDLRKSCANHGCVVLEQIINDTLPRFSYFQAASIGFHSMLVHFQLIPSPILLGKHQIFRFCLRRFLYASLSNPNSSSSLV